MSSSDDQKSKDKDKDNDANNNKPPAANPARGGKPRPLLGKAKLKSVANMIMEMRKQQSTRSMPIQATTGSSAEEHNSHVQTSTNAASQSIPFHDTANAPTHPALASSTNAAPSPMKTAIPSLFGSSSTSHDGAVTTSHATQNLLDHAHHLETLFAQRPVDSFRDVMPLGRTNSSGSGSGSVRGALAAWKQATRSALFSTPEHDEPAEVEVEYQYGSHSPTHNHNNNNTLGRDDIEQGNDATPLLSHSKSASPTNNDNPNNTTTAPPPPPLPPRRPTNSTPSCCNRFVHNLLLVLPPHEIAHGMQHFLRTTVLCFMLPCLGVAILFFYTLDNPDLEFLPTGARMSWFCLFALRQSVTFSLAQMTQWIFSVMTVRTTLLVRCAGPLLALVVMQSMGWPFLCASWGGWNLLILHGQQPWVQHWLHGSHIRLFSIQYNYGDGFLASDLYGRCLVALMLVGVAAAAKRTFVALYLSRRMLQYYRPPLELVLARVKLIMEVAELAAQTQDPSFAEQLEQYHNNNNSNNQESSTAATAAVLTSKQVAMDRKAKRTAVDTVPTFDKAPAPKKKDDDDSDDDSDDDGVLVIVNSKSDSHGSDLDDDDENDNDDAATDTATDTETDDPVQRALEEEEHHDRAVQANWESLKQRVFSDRYNMKFGGGDDTSVGSRSKAASAPIKGRHQRQSASVSGGTGSRRGISIAAILPFLDRWQEPEDKGRKQAEPTLHDILQFRKALAFMEDGAPLSHSFGKTPTRKACVKNAVRVYKHLLNFTPQQALLPFDVIGALAYKEDGTLDEEKAMDLLRLFQPDNNNMLSMLAFVQACDNVYKKLRFLRASISNSSKIDSVLEDIFNFVFYCVLAVVIVFLCGFNPWPILVSLSTFTVSFAFAFGNSVAKWVEGILLIAVRRPYDIGDRITITGAEVVSNPGVADTWIVEDITLTTTTLRYGGTNEVATINNASVSNSRIVNSARSPRAIVAIKVRFDIDATQGQLDLFRRRLISYLEDRSRAWVGLIQYRSEQIDSDSGFVEYVFRAQHVKTWQELPNILVDKGEWERYADAIATEMGIILDSPPKNMTIGLGLAPESDRDKATDDRRRVADFIQTIHQVGRESTSTAEDPHVREAISEFYGGADGTTAVALPGGDDGTATDAGASLPVGDGSGAPDG